MTEELNRKTCDNLVEKLENYVSNKMTTTVEALVTTNIDSCRAHFCLNNRMRRKILASTLPLGKVVLTGANTLEPL